MTDAQDALFSAEMLANPYPTYHGMRAADPVCWEPMLNGWACTAYEDVVHCLSHPDLSVERVGRMPGWVESASQDLSPLIRTLESMMLFADGTRHQRLRGLVSKAFTPRAVERMQAHIQDIVDRHLDALDGKSQMDVIADLANPLPTTVIAEMLGVPVDDRAAFKRWSDDFAMVFANVTTTDAENARVMESVADMTRYFRPLVEQLRDDPQDNLLSGFALAELDGDRLTTEELFANVILILVAGHETTTNLIGNGTWAFLQHPEQLRAVQDDPELLHSAIDELLRYDSPVQFTARLATKDIQLRDHVVHEGQTTILILGAANRDPNVFAEPDSLDIRRAHNRHLAFGHGHHFCLGAVLARMEGQAAFSSLLKRYPGLRLADAPPRYRPNFNLRGLESLIVAI
ncbi:MAG: cytochrome P450 [Chloroflexota bacterium]